LVLKKLDGYPVIREVLEEEKEEEMTTMDIREIQNMAEELDVDQEYFLTFQKHLEIILSSKRLEKHQVKGFKLKSTRRFNKLASSMCLLWIKLF